MTTEAGAGAPGLAQRRPGPAALGRLWRVTYPLIVTSLAAVALNAVDAALLARFSTYAVAAVGVAATA
jgi:Na+-driven multidrug efflux pump